MYLLRIILVPVIMIVVARIVAAPISATADLHIHDDISVLFKGAIDNCHEQNFEAAIAMANELHNAFPEDPAGVLALVYIYQSITDTYRVTAYQTRIDSLADIAVHLAKSAIKKDRKSGINYFYLATACGTRSISYARRGKWLDAFRDGRNIRRNFDKALKMNPRFYDAYYGMGIFDYWFADKSKVLRLLLTSKEEAIAEVKKAKKKGHFLQTTAMFGLSAIFCNERAYEKALVICDSLFEKHPGNPTIHFRRGTILENLGQWHLAKASFESLHEILVNTKFQSPSYQIDCLYHLANCDLELKNIETARLSYSKAVEMAMITPDLEYTKACLELRDHLNKVL